jgi:hypothetical protein
LKNRRRLKPAPYSRAVQAREEVAHASWSCVKAATPRPRATLSVVTRRRHDRDASVRSGLGDFSGGEQPWHAPVYESIRFDSIRGKRLRRTKTRLDGCYLLPPFGGRGENTGDDDTRRRGGGQTGKLRGVSVRHSCAFKGLDQRSRHTAQEGCWVLVAVGGGWATSTRRAMKRAANASSLPPSGTAVAC